MKKLVVLLSVFVLSMFLAAPAMADTLNATAVVDSVTATASPNVTVNNVGAEQKDLTTAVVDAKGYRGFPIGPQMTYPMMPTYLNGPTDGASVTDLKTFLIYGNMFDLPTLDAMTNQSGFDFFSLGLKVITVAECPKVADDARPAKIKALMKDQVKGVYKRAATITVKATDLNTTSEKLLAAAMLEAASYGASEVHVIDAGKHRVMSGSGWGIGIYYYAAGLNSAETSGQMGGGGTGYSTGESGYQDKPWVKVIAVIPAK